MEEQPVAQEVLLCELLGEDSEKYGGMNHVTCSKHIPGSSAPQQGEASSGFSLCPLAAFGLVLELSVPQAHLHT